MGWFTAENVEDYLAAAGEFLAARPADNTLLLTVAETLRARGPNAFGEVAPLFGWWRSVDGVVEAAFHLTSPYPILVTRLPAPAMQPFADALANALADALAERDRPVSGVNASVETAEAFAAAWAGRTGAHRAVHQRQRLHRLGELNPPRPPPKGEASVATAADKDLLVEWYEAFAREADSLGGNSAALVADRMSYGGLVLWRVGGTPVSLAGTTRRVARMVRVGPVYTPPEHRGRGYAAAVTAHVSRRARDKGAREVLLFTDLANPTSNALYERLGYRPADDRLVLMFTC